ncbi:Maf family protein [Nitrosomonas supralitoralis]|uniref:7-methyl-GTP pyrophosphatase n=1 Tax=Nitrosomonas supralitoralis TaxID=2116706 RepID=A0A2P7NSY3_9PROT|nr:Maf family nucleotide pyrophosphatase [Nitrosomonas supralitoralis]PSJ16577.1 septum formation inhibitor Maf [Nitrosomonas supralitoralis]
MKTQKFTQQIILGSGSIYRKELLQRLQIPFETSNPKIDEMPLCNELPEQTAARLAEAKARAVAQTYPQALIIGSDQVAALGDIRLGKPLNHVNAVEQLRQTRGKEVVFYTAVCLLNSFTDKLQIRVIPYHVKFRQLSDQQIENYLIKEQPYQCAGSAKSEGLGIALIERMTGNDPSGLIGLPLITLIDMLNLEGVNII